MKVGQTVAKAKERICILNSLPVKNKVELKEKN